MIDISHDDAGLLHDGETIDDAPVCALRIIQKKNGYRYSLDAFLLVHFVSLKKYDRTVLDLGTGSGVVALALAKRWPAVKAAGLDIQKDLADMARRSTSMNGLSDRVDIVCGDARLIKNLYEARTFDAVVSNPPYRKLHSGRINPDGQKALARHEIQGTLDDFLMAAAFVLKKSGRVFLIYPAARLVELMARMRAARLEPKRLRLIHSKPGMDGDLVLVEGLKDGREDLHILPPLFVYGQEGQYTEEMGAIFAALSRPAFP